MFLATGSYGLMLIIVNRHCLSFQIGFENLILKPNHYVICSRRLWVCIVNVFLIKSNKGRMKNLSTEENYIFLQWKSSIKIKIRKVLYEPDIQIRSVSISRVQIS